MTSLLILLAAANPGLHVSVDGEGYLRFAKGEKAIFARDVQLTAANGLLSSVDGYPVLPQIHVSDPAGLKVSMDGTVTTNGKTIGRLVLVSLPQTGLQASKSYWTSPAHGSIGYPGEGLFGIVKTYQKAGGAPAKTASVPKIEVKLRSEITKDQILLGDIADLSGLGAKADTVAATDLGSTPIFGSQRIITKSYILAKLRSEGLKPDGFDIQCPAGALVIRKGQTVTEDVMVAKGTDEAKTRFGIDYALRSQRAIPDLFVPCGQLDIKARDIVQNGETVILNLEFDVDNVPATTRTIYLIPAVPLPQVRAGDPIKIRVIKDGATVEVAGTARSTARVGASITVQTEAGAALTGIVKSVSLVEVKI